MIEKTENITNLAAALLKAQKAMSSALKDATNPYYKSSYADLKAVIEAIKEPLNSNGIAFLQAVNGDHEFPSIETMLLHESGQFLCSRTPVFCSKPKDPQAFGSGITYSKRYALQAILGLPTKDDDAEAAMGRNDSSSKPAKGTQKKSAQKVKQNEIVDLAWLQFESKHQAILKQESFIHFEFDLDMFKKAIIKQFKALPTNKASVKLITEKIKPEDCLKEKKKDD